MPVKAGQILKRLVRIGTEPDGCWLWLGATNDDGYPVKEFCGRTEPAARWLWAIFNGPIKGGRVLSASCGDRACVNPAHQALTTVAAVNRDTHGKLFEGEVLAIRSGAENGQWGDHQAAVHGVAPSTLYRVRRGDSYADVGGTFTRRELLR
jgi:hypothetical protein